MDPESSLNSLGNEALRDLYNNLIQAKQFVLDQAPDVCRQIIAWEITEGVMAAVVAVVLWIVFYFRYKVAMATLRDHKAVMQDKEIPKEIPAVGIAVALGIASVVAIATACVEGAEAIRAIVAPKLVLIDCIARWIK